MFKFIRKISFFALILVLVVSGSILFFEDQLTGFIDVISTKNFRPENANTEIKIGYAFAPESLNPLLFDYITRSRLVDIYEGLVKLDQNLKAKPGLAISWGMLDEKNWEFIIRPNIVFHDGKKLELEDIIYSFEAARSDPDSQLVNLLSSVESVKAELPDKIIVQTKYPDPLLITKIAQVFIFSKNFKDFEHPVGTGPYKFMEWSESRQQMEKFSNYWDEKPYFDKVTLEMIPGKDARIEALKNGEIDLLVNVPPDQVKQLENSRFHLEFIPSLEVGFLMFNFHNEFLSKLEIRQAIAMAINREAFLDLASGYAHVVNQFVGSGVFGYNPNLESSTFNLAQAKKLLSESVDQFQSITLIFDYPSSLILLGQYVKEQLAELGIEVQLNPLDDEELADKIKQGESDFYYLGWRNELGDAFDFLQNIAHSKNLENSLGFFNGMNYVNAQVDQLIAKSQSSLSPRDRLKNMQDIMKVMVEDDVVGVPLFETNLIFAFEKNLDFQPRVDGVLYVAELSRKVRLNKTR